jgi:hypothetical protein
MRVLRKYRIGAVLAHDPNPVVSDAAVGRMASAPAAWALLNVSGRSALFGWSGDGRSFAGARLDLEALAFDPAPDRRVPPTPPTAAPLAPPRWYDDFLRPPPALRVLERDEADLYVTLFDGRRASARATPQLVGGFSVGSFAGLGAAAAGPFGLPVWSVVPAFPTEFGSRDRALAEYAHLFRGPIVRDAALGPIAPLLLAIRSARRAVAGHPRDAGSYLALGEAYLRLARVTRESIWARELPDLVELRRVQAVTALTQAVRLEPNAFPAHFALYGVFREVGAYDLALRELKEVARLQRPTDPGAGERSGPEAEMKSLTDLVAVLRSRLPSAQAAPVAQRAQRAAELGLHGEALDLVLGTDVAALGNDGLQLEVELLLFTGRSAEVLDWVTADHRAALGPVTYHWSRARASAATGDYAEFDAQMRELAEFLGTVTPPGGAREELRTHLTRGLGRAILLRGISPAGPGDVLMTGLARSEVLDQSVRFTGLLVQILKSEVLRGLLALESGDTRRAGDLFRSAVRIWGSPQQVAQGEGIDFPGRRAAEEALGLLRGTK